MLTTLLIFPVLLSYPPISFLFCHCHSQSSPCFTDWVVSYLVDKLVLHLSTGSTASSEVSLCSGSSGSLPGFVLSPQEKWLLHFLHCKRFFNFFGGWGGIFLAFFGLVSHHNITIMLPYHNVAFKMYNTYKITLVVYLF